EAIGSRNIAEVALRLITALAHQVQVGIARPPAVRAGVRETDQRQPCDSRRLAGQVEARRCNFRLQPTKAFEADLSARNPKRRRPRHRIPVPGAMNAVGQYIRMATLAVDHANESGLSPVAVDQLDGKPTDLVVG